MYACLYHFSTNYAIICANLIDGIFGQKAQVIYLYRKKLKLKAEKYLLMILNLAGILLAFVNPYTHFLNMKFVIPYEYILIYAIVSISLIQMYFKHKLKEMYLRCGLDEIDEMTGVEFEVYLYYKFRKMGYKVKMTPVTGDYGADLILKKRKERIVVQAKRYKRDVGISAVQEVIGSIAYYNANRGVVITNSFFTPNAINLAIANDIVLWDRKALITCFIKEEESLESYEWDYSVPDSDRNCPVCGKKLVRRKGPYGYFLGCCGYPECNYTKTL